MCTGYAQAPLDGIYHHFMNRYAASRTNVSPSTDAAEPSPKAPFVRVN